MMADKIGAIAHASGGATVALGIPTIFGWIGENYTVIAGICLILTTAATVIGMYYSHKLKKARFEFEKEQAEKYGRRKADHESN